MLHFLIVPFIGADEKNGAHGKASLFLKPIVKERFGFKSVPITPFRGHRFNILALTQKSYFASETNLSNS